MDLKWLDEFSTLAMSWGVTAVGGVALIILGFLAARLVRATLAHALRRVRLDGELVELLSSLAYYLTVAVIVIAAFGVMGIETASLITILGTCTLAIGLALQGSLSNFSSGIILFTFRPFRTNDFIETGDYMGTVTEIGVFSTKIDSQQNIRIDIPNSYISQRPLLNWSRNGSCRLDLVIEVAIKSNIGNVKQAIADALSSEARILNEPAPFIGIENFGDSSAIYAIRAWCTISDYWVLKLELPESIKTAIESVDATMPTPQREVIVIGSGNLLPS